MTDFVTPPPCGEVARPYEQQVVDARAAMPDALRRALRGDDGLADVRGLLVAFDIDGTLLSASGASERVRCGLAELSARGAQVVIASGRALEAVLPVLPILGVSEGWLVCSNGSMTVHACGENIDVHRLHTFPADEAVRTVLDTLPDARVAVEQDGYLLVSQEFPPGELVEPHRVGSREELQSAVTPKVVVRIPGMGLEEFTQVMAETGLSERHEVFVGWTSWADVGPRGVSKASALDELVEELGLSHEATVALGDGSNDVEMLEWAAWGVAMGGASAQVRAHADYVTGAVENDGAAAVMDALLGDRH